MLLNLFVFALVLTITLAILWIIWIKTAKVPKLEGPTITLKEFLENAQTGDLVFLSGTTYPEQVIKRLTGSPYSHVAIVLVEGGTPYLWEADIGQGCREGPRVIAAKDKFDRWKGVKVGTWKRYLGVRPSTEDFVKVAYSHINKGMDMKMARWFTASKTRRDIEKDRSEVYCSELVAMTLRDLGMAGMSKKINPGWYSPELLRSMLEGYGEDIRFEF